MRTTYLSLIFLTLTACGGGGGSEPTASTPAAASNNAPPPAASSTNTNPTQPPATQLLSSTPQIIEYYGDSTVWGWASNSGGARVAKPAPTVFAETLPATPRHEVRNEGVSGTGACELLRGQDGHQPWNEQMTASNATVVIINHGINDRTQYNVATYRSCLTDLAQIAKQRGKYVIFETPNPIFDSAVESYVTAMREVASQQQVQVIDQYKYLSDYLRDNNLNVYDIVPDGLHPTDQVYGMKGRYAAQVFVTLPAAR